MSDFDLDPQRLDDIVERVILISRLRKEHTARVRENLAEKGIELTIEQVEKERADALEAIREGLRKKGYDPPHDDWLFLGWVYEALNQEKEDE